MKRSEVLNRLDIKENKEGMQTSFSIKFVQKNGQVTYLKRAVKTGAKFNLSKNKMRSVVQINSNGDSIGHPYPVHIDSIIEFNGKKVTL